MKLYTLILNKKLLFLVTILLTISTGNIFANYKNPPNDSPSWIKEGSTLARKSDNRFFLGVGIAEPTKTTSSQKTAADKMAISESARLLNDFIKSVINEYSATNSNKKNSSTENIANGLRSAIESATSTGKIMGRWAHRYKVYNKSQMTIYSRAEIKLSNVITSFETNNNIDQSIKRYISENGNAIFDQLSNE